MVKMVNVMFFTTIRNKNYFFKKEGLSEYLKASNEMGKTGIYFWSHWARLQTEYLLLGLSPVGKRHMQGGDVMSHVQ